MNTEIRVMSVEQLKQLIDLMCTEKVLWEKHYGQYDVSESVMAINAFHAVCHVIDAPDIEGFMRQLRQQVTAHQYNLSPEMDGSYSGGRGTWGNCLSSVEYLLHEQASFQRLKWQLRRDIVLIRIGVFALWSNWRLWLVMSCLFTLAWLAIV
ncbi:hypothetical protein [Thalassomonas haliotis]|uniref:Uncharacterized protein n=1 Tax=Thalassomonas haliotis TaxID=485448 RepID=A0ABY7VAZ8_9GAMM|nr:hypothetical protein [Thalassomonas haliotis]WDE10511.1 hypothetical protein H3N35_19920 [Thalassomonas haliotis]